MRFACITRLMASMAISLVCVMCNRKSQQQDGGGHTASQIIAVDRGQKESEINNVILPPDYLKFQKKSEQDIAFEVRARALAGDSQGGFAGALHDLNETWMVDQQISGPAGAGRGPAYRIIARMDDEEFVETVASLPAGSLRKYLVSSNNLGIEMRWKLYNSFTESADRSQIASRLVRTIYFSQGIDAAKHAIIEIGDRADMSSAAASLMSHIFGGIMKESNEFALNGGANGNATASQSLLNLVENYETLQTFLNENSILAEGEIPGWATPQHLIDKIKHSTK